MNQKPTKRIFFLFIFLTQFIAQSQIIINEVAQSNANWIADENGDYGDYIELYNAGATAQDISGWGLTDLPTNKFKWVFPSGTSMAAGSHLLIFADDKNKSVSNLPNLLPHHWETIIKDNDIWQYNLGINSSPPSTWKNIDFTPTNPWPTGPGGFGFGDVDDNTTTPTNANTVYIRKIFNIADKTQISSAILSIDFDDGIVAYLNGYKVGSLKIEEEPVEYFTPAVDNHEARLYLNNTVLDTLMLNYNQIQQLMVNGTNVLAIEVHNAGETSSDLTLRPFFHLGIIPTNDIFGKSNPAWFSAPSFTALPYYYHTNFKISANENISLFNTNGILQSNLNSGATLYGNLMCRIPDGAENICHTNTASPFSTNNSAPCFTGYSAQVAINIPAGSYSTNKTISLSCPTLGSSIYYTLNGDYPTTSNTLYTGPISISATKTIKAICVATSLISLPPVTKSYFINENTQLPIVSISCDASTMTDFQTLTFESDLQEIGGHFEFFEKNGGTLLYEADCGVDQQGKGSTQKNPKSLEISAKTEYGVSKFNYKFFSKKNYTNFDKLILRSGGNDVLQGHIQDYFCLNLLEKINFNSQSSRPVVLFTNGKYRGVYFLNEGIDEQFVENLKGVTEENLDHLKKDWKLPDFSAIDGNTLNFRNFRDFWKNNDLGNETFFNEAISQVNKNKFIDWLASCIIMNNRDWVYLDNNIRFFSDRTQNPTKWEPIAWDFDSAFQDIFSGYSGENIDQLITKQQSTVAEMFRSFMANTTFKKELINRTADLINTTFSKDTMMATRIANKNEINFDYQRMLLHYGLSNNYWETKLLEIDNNIAARHTSVWNKYKTNFSLPDTVTIRLETNIAVGGTILLNTIAPKIYPWKGVYFKGNPIKIQAIPKPGYEFTGWSIVSGSTSPIASNDLAKALIEGLVSAPTKFIANFALSSTSQNALLVDEINYHSSDDFEAGDWIELYNPGPLAFDASGYSITNNIVANKYTLPPHTIIQANERIVLTNNLTEFHTMHKNVNNYLSTTLFSLSNSGDNVKINSPDNSAYKNVNYDDIAPWPLNPDGGGSTLQLQKEAINLNLPSNWLASCIGGSPGIAYQPPMSDLSVDPIEVFNLQEGVLTAIGCSSGTIKWYDSKTDGVEIASGTTFMAPAITSPVTYFARCETPLCSQTERLPVVVSPIICADGAEIWTVKSGLWTDPTVWSCYRIPLPNDYVKISGSNSINLPSGVFEVKQLIFEGNLILEENANIQLNNN